MRAGFLREKEGGTHTQHEFGDSWKALVDMFPVDAYHWAFSSLPVIVKFVWGGGFRPKGGACCLVLRVLPGTVFTCRR